jgi:hypothetical protein
MGINNAELYWNSKPHVATLLGDGHSTLRSIERDGMHMVFCQVTPELFANPDQPECRESFRRTSYLINRLLLNLGAQSKVSLLPLLCDEKAKDQAWLHSVYLQTPIDVDDPYRFYGW